MEYRTRRNSKVIGVIGFGAWQLGNKDNWQGSDFDSGIKLVKSAIDLGVTFFDTAPNYANGQSEKILGQAITENREKLFINTKVGHGPDGAYEFTRSGIQKSVKRSLERLQTTYLDSVILHNPEKYILSGRNELTDTLTELKAEGLIHNWGVSIDSLDELRLVLDNLDVDIIEIMFNMIHQEPKALFDEVLKREIILVIKVPLDSGWLSGKYDEFSTFTGIRDRWSKEIINTRAQIVKKIKSIVGLDNLISPALRFIIDHPAVTAVIPGTRNEEQLRSNLSALDYHLDKTMKKQLEDLYENEIKNKEIPW